MGAKRPYDPLDDIPSAAVLRQLLADADARAERLRILLEIAERLEATVARQDAAAQQPEGGAE